MALKYHPDKMEKSDATAGDMFQKILCAYNILKDTNKRAIYDKTGVVSDKDPTSVEQFVEAYQYYRNEFPELREQDIESFEQKYRNSIEEKNDLIEFYLDNEGKMTLILQNIILSRNSDIKRFLKFFEQELKSGEQKEELLKWKKNFNKTKKKIKKLSTKEAKEAKKLKEDRLASLSQAILLRRKERNQAFLNNFESAFTDFPEHEKKEVLRDNKKVTNQGKRATPNFSIIPKNKKGRKKVKRLNK